MITYFSFSVAPISEALKSGWKASVTQSLKEAFKASSWHLFLPPHIASHWIMSSKSIDLKFRHLRHNVQHSNSTESDKIFYILTVAPTSEAARHSLMGYNTNSILTLASVSYISLSVSWCTKPMLLNLKCVGIAQPKKYCKIQQKSISGWQKTPPFLKSCNSLCFRVWCARVCFSDPYIKCLVSVGVFGRCEVCGTSRRAKM